MTPRIYSRSEDATNLVIETSLLFICSCLLSMTASRNIHSCNDSTFFVLAVFSIAA